MDSAIKTLYVMRGPSGGGKTYKAQQILAEVGKGKIVSADYFWGEEYRFTPSYLGLAHRWCVGELARNMLYGITPLVLDNTNTQAWEPQEAVKLALQFGYQVQIVEADSDWCKNAEVCFQKNQHKVPLEVIKAQLARYEDNFTVDRILAAQTPHRN